MNSLAPYDYPEIINLNSDPEVVSINLDEFLELDIPERKLLLAPWLPEQGLAMVCAPRGIGKTFFALNVAYAVGSGGSFLGWQAERPRSILYIDGEMPASALQERLAAIAHSNDLEAQNFEIINPDLQEFGVPDLSSKEGQLALAPYTDKAELIVVDNISTLCRSTKENDGDSWGIVQDWALQLRSRGKSVLFVHHAGKSGEQRGTSRREDVLDTVISLKSLPDHDAKDGAKFQVLFSKSRGFCGDDAASMEVALTTNADKQQVWVFETMEDSTFNRVVELFKSDLSQADIARELDVNRSTVSRHIKRAKQEGLL